MTYAASIRRLARLSHPQVKLVLGAHNIPVASPAVLPRLVWRSMRFAQGKFLATPDSPARCIYKVDGISFLMRAPTAHS